PRITHTVLCLILLVKIFANWISVQINCSITTACICYHRGFYKKDANYCGDHFLFFFP
ncbi:putative signal peptide protein, partial [Puccinia sorghi]